MTLDPSKWRLSGHAQGRMEEMRLTDDEVTDLLLMPGIIADQGRKSKYRDSGQKLYMRGDYTAVVAPGDPNIVVTFLYRYKTGWHDSQQVLSDDREYRPDSHLPDNPNA